MQQEQQSQPQIQQRLPSLVTMVGYEKKTKKKLQAKKKNINPSSSSSKITFFLKRKPGNTTSKKPPKIYQNTNQKQPFVEGRKTSREGSSRLFTALKEEPMESFFGDPRYSKAINKVLLHEYLNLKDHKVLHMNILDFFLQSACRTLEKETYESKSLLGSFYTFNVMEQHNKYTPKNQSAIKRMQTQMRKLVLPGNKFIIIPYCGDNHFMVFLVETDSEAYLKSVVCYDSLQKSSRHSHLPSPVRKFLQTLCIFWNKNVKSSKDNNQQNNLLKNVVLKECPQQKNSIDCGLFAVGICLHLLDGIDIQHNTFTQDNITLFRNNVSKTMGKWLEEGKSVEENINGNPFHYIDHCDLRGHFPLLSIKNTNIESLAVDTIEDLGTDDLPSTQQFEFDNLPSTQQLEEEIEYLGTNDEDVEVVMHEGKVGISDPTKDNTESISSSETFDIKINVTATKKTFTKTKDKLTVTTQSRNQNINITSTNPQPYMDRFIQQMIEKKNVYKF